MEPTPSPTPSKPSSQLQACNRTELYQLCRNAGMVIHPGSPREWLLGYLTGELEPPPMQEDEHPIDKWRLAFISFLGDYWDKIHPQLRCHARNFRHYDPAQCDTRPCFKCPDAKVMMCVAENSANIEVIRRYLPKEVSMQNMISMDNAPRDLNELKKLQRSILWRLAMQLRLLSNDAEEAGYMAASPEAQAQIVLNGLLAADAEGSIPQQQPQMQPQMQMPPAAPAAPAMPQQPMPQGYAQQVTAPPPQAYQPPQMPQMPQAPAAQAQFQGGNVTYPGGVPNYGPPNLPGAPPPCAAPQAPGAQPAYQPPPQQAWGGNPGYAPPQQASFSQQPSFSQPITMAPTTGGPVNIPQMPMRNPQTQSDPNNGAISPAHMGQIVEILKKLLEEVKSNNQTLQSMMLFLEVMLRTQLAIAEQGNLSSDVVAKTLTFQSSDIVEKFVSTVGNAQGKH